MGDDGKAGKNPVKQDRLIWYQYSQKMSDFAVLVRNILENPSEIDD